MDNKQTILDLSCKMKSSNIFYNVLNLEEEQLKGQVAKHLNTCCKKALKNNIADNLVKKCWKT